MLKLEASVCIDATKENTWNVLSDLENNSLWSEPVHSSICVSQSKKGIGTIRECTLTNSVVVNEEIVYWSDGVSFSYLATGIPFVRKAKNTWAVEQCNGKTLVTTNAEVEIKYGAFGRMFEPMIAMISMRTRNKSLASLKYLVENGQPFSGHCAKQSKLKMIN